MLITSTQDAFSISSGAWRKCFPSGRFIGAAGGQIIWPSTNTVNLLVLVLPVGSTAPVSTPTDLVRGVIEMLPGKALEGSDLSNSSDIYIAVASGSGSGTISDLIGPVPIGLVPISSN